MDDVRALFKTAEQYLEGRSNLAALSGQVELARRHLRMLGETHPVLTALLNEWREMINRCWNEWGFEEEPLSEAEFRAWLQAQLIARTRRGGDS